MEKVFVLIFIIGFTMHVQAQEVNTEEPKNVLYGSVGNLVLWFTTNANYERLIKTKDANIFSRYYLHVGFGGYAAWAENGRSTDVSFRWLGGRKKSHLELGVGVVSLFDSQGYDIAKSNTQGYEPEPSRDDYRDFYPAATVGYRFQKLRGGLVFRTGLASPDGVYLSLGYAF